MVGAVEARAHPERPRTLIEHLQIEVAGDARRRTEPDEQVLDTTFDGEVACPVRRDEETDLRQVETRPRLVEAELREHVGRRRAIGEIERAAAESEAHGLRRSDERVWRIHRDQFGDRQITGIVESVRAGRKQRRHDRVAVERALAQAELDAWQRETDLLVFRVRHELTVGLALRAAQEWRTQHDRREQEIEREARTRIIRRRCIEWHVVVRREHRSGSHEREIAADRGDSSGHLLRRLARDDELEVELRVLDVDPRVTSRRVVLRVVLGVVESELHTARIEREVAFEVDGAANGDAILVEGNFVFGDAERAEHRVPVTERVALQHVG